MIIQMEPAYYFNDIKFYSFGIGVNHLHVRRALLCCVLVWLPRNYIYIFIIEQSY